MKPAFESRTIRDFGAGVIVGGAMVLLWGIPALSVSAGYLHTNPIPTDVLTGGLALIAASSWAIKRRFQTEEKLWK
jgi:drug/metabolite transporter (DMT)-like permease